MSICTRSNDWSIAAPMAAGVAAAEDPHRTLTSKNLSIGFWQEVPINHLATSIVNFLLVASYVFTKTPHGLVIWAKNRHSKHGLEYRKF
ncbi:hypothetical protein QL285_090455 [Trifolium repens]|nr:hypothetical protein QL285_090455 [Trifolium repens]